MVLNLVNPSDRNWTKRRYVLAFGATGTTYCLVWANGIDTAFDVAVDWIVDNAPGLLADDEVQAEYERLLAEGLSVEQAQAQAEIDMVSGGNAGNYLHSWEWSIVADQPTRAELKDLIERLGGVAI